MILNKDDYVVYMHICPNGKKYIGITCTIPKLRWNNGRGYKCNKHFWDDITKYGWDEIQHIIVAENLSPSNAYKLEVQLIEKYNTDCPDYGYNIEKGIGFGRPNSVKEKLRTAQLIYWRGKNDYRPRSSDT